MPAEDDTKESLSVILDTGKWLAVAFAAIGAVFITGLQLSDIASLAPPWRAGALASVIVTLGGVGVALWATTDILTPRYKLLGDLWKEAKTQHALLQTGLFESHGPSALQELDRKFNQARNDLNELTAQGDKTSTAYEKALRETRLYRAILTQLEDLGNYYSHVFLYESRRRLMFKAAAFAALGIVGFALTAKATGHSNHTLVGAGQAKAILFEPLRDRVREQLGGSCDAFQPATYSDVIVLGDEEGAVDLVTIPTDPCPKPVRFTLRLGLDGSLEPPKDPAPTLGRPVGY